MDTEIKNHTASDEPLYNIGVVSRMTGISVATLRAWERRYGFPSSGRTAGGHRLYSEKDMVRLRWVKSQIEQGLQTAQAIQVLRRRETPEHGPRQWARPAGLGEPTALPASRPEVPVVGVVEPDIVAELAPGSGDALAGFEHRLTAALLQYDTATADHILGEVLLSYSLDELIFKLIEPAFNEIGKAWEEKRLTIAMEHLTTHYLRHRLLMWMLSGPPLYPTRPVVLACAPGELHEGSLLILGALLRRRRWPVAYLGQTVPLSDLASLVHDMEPPVVVLVAMTEPAAQALANWPDYFPDAGEPGQPVIAYGGRIFSEKREWRERMPGVFLGDSLQEGIAQLDQILTAMVGPHEERA